MLASLDKSLPKFHFKIVFFPPSKLCGDINAWRQADAEAGGGVPVLSRAPGQRESEARCVRGDRAHHHERVVRSVMNIIMIHEHVVRSVMNTIVS